MYNREPQSLKYVNLSQWYSFMPFAFEIPDPQGVQAKLGLMSFSVRYLEASWVGGSYFYQRIS